MSSPHLWYEKEQKFLRKLQAMCVKTSQEYMEVYEVMHKVQTRLRLPSIILSSFSGIASFGTTSFPPDAQKYVSIAVGIVNITIAMLQTYESYLKIADTVSKSVTATVALKRLGEDIDCELYIPIENRELAGNTFLRNSFNKYQAIIADAPILPINKNEAEHTFAKLMEEADNELWSPRTTKEKLANVLETSVALEERDIRDQDPTDQEKPRRRGRIEFDLEASQQQQTPVRG